MAAAENERKSPAAGVGRGAMLVMSLLLPPTKPLLETPGKLLYTVKNVALQVGANRRDN